MYGFHRFHGFVRIFLEFMLKTQAKNKKNPYESVKSVESVHPFVSQPNPIGSKIKFYPFETATSDYSGHFQTQSESTVPAPLFFQSKCHHSVRIGLKPTESIVARNKSRFSRTLYFAQCSCSSFLTGL
jgi:hypothetical protein